MSTTRRSKLTRIMKIDQTRHSIESNIKYRKMRNNLKILESNVFGSRYIRIGSPEMDDVIQGYNDGLEKYEDRLGKLNREKKQLQNELFPFK